MRKIAGLILFGAALAAIGNLAAQSIAITPSGIPQVVVGGTVQFSAQVTGLSSNAVAWYSGGVKGGNSTAGTISSAGLYQAPTKLPGQNPVQITAISSVNSKISATTYVYLLGLGPTITAVSPNPISTGTITVTVQGSTFQTGALVYITYGSNSLVQMSTTAVTPTTVTATGYLGPATTATFSVKNPGTGYSNSIVVPVGNAPPPKYTLKVVKGTGGGSYTAGTVVTITANAAPSGQSFTGWTGAAVANPGASSTTLKMPAANTTVTANYSSSAATYTLTVVNGSGSGSYTAGTKVNIAANTVAGESFVNWTGATVNSPSSPSTYLNMPAANTTVTANYTAATYTLTVVNGSGSGSYIAGTKVNIAANTVAGESFVNWTGATVNSPSSPSTYLTMPAANTTVTANYTAATYTLTVVNGSGSGSYAAGTKVNIAANTLAGESFVNWTGATVNSPNSSSTYLTMPAANTTVTANYTATTYTLTVVNGSGSGSYASGAVVNIAAGTPPAGEYFVNWTGASVNSPSSSSTTLTMPAAATTVTANFGAAPAIPYPVSSHPRLWVTPNDVTRLRGWATSSNPVYQQGMAPLLQQVVNVYNTQFFPNGVPNPNYPDPGDTQGYQGDLTEQYGFILAFNSLIDPSPANRIQYAQYTRNLLMYAMNQAAQGPLSGAPFRDPMFAVYNRANGSGEQWPLMVDWIYSATDGAGNPILSASDKATLRNVFMMWANACLNASTTGGDHPSPIGVMNSLQLLPNNQPYRMASNNYYLGHARLLTMMALAIDPGDDPPVNPAAPASQVGNTLRSYILDATGAWLYQTYAMMGEPAAVAAGYGIPGNGAGFGLASGGLPPEGMLYGHSFGFVLGQLLALQTAGFNNVSISGPQAQLIGAPVWDRYVTGFISSLVPTAQVYPSEAWLGPVYEFASYGDLLRLWATPEFMQPLALLALLDQQNGKTSHLNAARWFAVNATEGGAGALYTRITEPWSYSSTASVLYFLLLDPTAPPATDPRPAFPTTFFDPAAGRILAHSDWTANGTMFDYRASWISINHQLGDGGQFELYRKGEWLTKEMSNYDNNALGMTSMYHNTLALQNWCADGTPANLQWYESGEWANGSMWMEGMDAGDPTTVTSTGPGYVYASSNLTNLFNRPDYWSPNDAAVAITQATRSIVWLANDYIVVYDRATSSASGLFKRFNLSLVTNPSIAGNVATETLATGQQLYVQTLLPHNASITAAYDVSNLNPVAQLEPTQYILTVEDLSKPSDTRFLHVLQGADPGAPMAAATYLESSSGTSFDGAVFGTAAVYFPVSGNGAFAGTSLPVPAGIHTVLVTGLAANGTYTVAVQGTAITITAGGGATADAAGVLMVSL